MQSIDKPVAGDWDGDGDDDAGIFRAGQWHLRSGAQATGATVETFLFGATSGQPVVGYGSDPAMPGVGTFRPRTG
jgi:serine-aspartate repeat-containing protein C/D/E